MSDFSIEVTDIARAAARTELLKILADPLATGAVVSGPIGSAKSALVDKVLGEDLLKAVRLLCSPGLAESNFGAIYPFLVEFEGHLTEVGVLNYLSHYFDSTVRDSKILVVVEEAHYLDAASAFVLTQLALAGRIKLLLLAVGQGHTESVVTSVELGARLGRIALGSLSDQDVADYCRELIGGPVTSATAQTIARLCAGNRILIGAFTRAALDQEFLVESKGRYVLTQSRLDNDVHLASAVEDIQKRLSGVDAEAMEILALGGAEYPEILQERSGAQIGRLVETGLVRFSSESRIEIAAPVHAQILRDIVPPGRSKRLWQLASQGCENHGTLPETVMWDCESGCDVTVERLVAAATCSNDKRDYTTALRLCQESGESEKDPSVALQAMRAMVGMNRYQPASDSNARTLDQDSDLRHLIELGLMETAAQWGVNGTPDQVNGLLQTWKCHVKMLESKQNPLHQHLKSRCERITEVLELHLAFAWRQNVREIIGRAMRCEQECERGSLEYLICRDVICEIKLASGRAVEAADMALESLEAIPASSDTEYVAGCKVLTTALRALFAAGEYEKIRELWGSNQSESLNQPMIRNGILNFWAAFAAIQEGRWRLALELLDEARAELAIYDPYGLFILSEGLDDFAKSQLDTAVLREVCDHNENKVRLECGGLEYSETTVLAAAYRHVSRHPEEPGYLLTLIDGARAAERLHVEQQLLTMLWRFSMGGQSFPREMERLSALSSVNTGRRSPALAEAALLGRTASVSVVLRTATKLFSSGETCLGPELLATFLGGSKDFCDERQRGVVLRQLASWVTELGGEAWGALRKMLSERGLTNREEEIIHLVRLGLSNKEIARDLTISQRTVEGHLYRIFAKLGINGRTELIGQQ